MTRRNALGMYDVIFVGAVWLRRRGLDVQVLVQVDGEWRVAISVPYDSRFSRIARALTIDAAPRAAVFPQEEVP